jgi:hypothetical protein
MKNLRGDEVVPIINPNRGKKLLVLVTKEQWEALPGVQLGGPSTPTRLAQ